MTVLTFASAEPELVKNVGDFTLNYYTCFTTQMGFDYFTQSVDTIFDEYIERYNSEKTSAYRKINTHKSAPFKGGEYFVGRNGDIEVSSADDRIDYSIGYTA
jgi:hypothetical protein